MTGIVITIVTEIRMMIGKADFSAVVTTTGILTVTAAFSDAEIRKTVQAAAVRTAIRMAVAPGIRTVPAACQAVIHITTATPILTGMMNAVRPATGMTIVIETAGQATIATVTRIVDCGRSGRPQP